jgi:RNA polymerase sigma-70 factor (ECF subfamily)
MELGKPLMDRSDAELMEHWRRGEAAAFAHLVRRWQTPVARFFGHLLGPAAPIPDLCQEVFLRIHHAGPRYREGGTFSTWLYRIALNVARDLGRRQKRQPISWTNGEVAADAPPPDLVCQQQELARLLAAAVADLPEPLRLVLVLRHYENMSFAQMSRLTGTPATTLKSRFASALTRLRDRLRSAGYDQEDVSP